MANAKNTDEPAASCCCPPQKKEGRGFLQGVLYGLLPHTICILFIVLSVVGATAATSVIRRFLYVPYLFQIIVALSFVFATISSAFYLRRQGMLSWEGARRRWKYVTVMFGTTVAINLLFFMVIFPLVANSGFSAAAPVVAAQSTDTVQAAVDRSSVTLQVQIPCPGHAPLVMDELKRVDGITSLKYQFPDKFVVGYDPAKLTVEKILAADVFKEFPAQVL